MRQEKLLISKKKMTRHESAVALSIKLRRIQVGDVDYLENKPRYVN
jgi:hypothetical protein